MFVVIGIGIPRGTANNYTTDPYCVWRNEDGTFERWPHDFQPTHFYELPLTTVQVNSTVRIKETIPKYLWEKISLPLYNAGENFIVTKIYDGVDEVNDTEMIIKWAFIKKENSYVWAVPLDWLQLVT